VKTAHALKQLGFEVYCPIKAEVRQWSDRKKKVRSPLFSKYLFVRTDEQNRNRVFQAAGVLNFLFWLKKPAVVPEQEINSLRSYLEDKAVDAKEIHCFKSGDSVALKHGFFKGQKAEIKKINNQRVELILPVLGYRLIARTRDLVA
jgi:transcription antitermination factor NusG